MIISTMIEKINKGNYDTSKFYILLYFDIKTTQLPSEFGMCDDTTEILYMNCKII